MPESDFELSAKKWLLGALAPIALAAQGIFYLVTRIVRFHTGRGPNPILVTLTGMEAIAVGLCFLFFAAFLHFRFVWNAPDAPERLAENADKGEAGSLIALIPCFTYAVFAMIRFFITN